MQSRPASKRRPDIQALRAIAVCAVVLNHLFPGVLPGGYVGVDVFFVISGYLITLHLVKEISQSGRVNLASFYSRRARRLLPAALLVSIVSLIASLIFISSSEWIHIANQTFAASAYFLNWVLSAQAVDYWTSLQSATPVQHFWSLSVEEQFYLFWPLFLLLVFWAAARIRLSIPKFRLLTFFFVFTAIVSFGFAIWATHAAKNATYFNTFARAWEFEVGGLVALGAAHFEQRVQRKVSHAKRLKSSLATVAVVVAYISLAVACLTFNSQTTFPGPWAALPVLATGIIIAASPFMSQWSPARIVGWTPIQFVGDISYSVYLWHWPLIVIAPWILSHELLTPDKFVILALTFILAALTKPLVEDRGRELPMLAGKPRRALLSALASIVAIGIATTGITAVANQLTASRSAQLAEIQTKSSGPVSCLGAESLSHPSRCPDPFGPSLIAPGGESEAPWSASAPECENKLLPGGVRKVWWCPFGALMTTGPATSAIRNVLLVGDSHAEHWKGALLDISRAQKWNLTYSALGGCPTADAPLTHTTDAHQASCQEWRDEVNRRVAVDRPDLIITSNFSFSEVIGNGSSGSESHAYATAVRSTFSKWTALGSKVVVLRDVPTAGEQLGPTCVSKRYKFARSCLAPQSDVVNPDFMADAAKAMKSASVRVIDPISQFCLKAVCSGVIGGLPVYFDHDHVSLSYSTSMVPFLMEQLTPAG